MCCIHAFVDARVLSADAGQSFFGSNAAASKLTSYVSPQHTRALTRLHSVSQYAYCYQSECYHTVGLEGKRENCNLFEIFANLYERKVSRYLGVSVQHSIRVKISLKPNHKCQQITTVD